ncbi:MAG: type II secretion system protein [Synergistaceae bacterium]|nr:type II secretion system protein [Synergistaceae bacterium]
MTSKRGFTLIEILVAVMIAGILSALALAPVAVTVRRVIDARREYTDTAAMSLAIDFMARDMFSAMRLSPSALTVKDHEAPGGNADDILMVMTTAPAMQNMTSGAAVYKVAEGGILHGDIIPGLYRWIIPNAEPSEIDPEKLNPEEAQLVLPGVNEFRVEIPTNEREDDNRKEYSGSLPAGVFIEIGRGESSNARTYITFP